MQTTRLIEIDPSDNLVQRRDPAIVHKAEIELDPHREIQYNELRPATAILVQRPARQPVPANLRALLRRLPQNRPLLDLPLFVFLHHLAHPARQQVDLHGPQVRRGGQQGQQPGHEGLPR